jgi:hypothetical protein
MPPGVPVCVCDTRGPLQVCKCQECKWCSGACHDRAAAGAWCAESGVTLLVIQWCVVVQAGRVHLLAAADVTLCDSSSAAVA